MSQSKNLTKVFGGLEVMNFVDSNNQRLQNVGTPIEPSDGANKAYVDNYIGGITINAGQGLINDSNTFKVDSNLSHVTQLGNIQTGTWSADAILVNYGGTGTTTFSPNKLIIGNGTNPLQSYTQATFTNSKVSFETPVEITNTSNSLTPTSGGAVTVMGGLGVVKNVNIGGYVKAIDGTIQNLCVPGNFSISTIQSFSSNFTNLTATNFNTSNTTTGNFFVTNITGTSQIITNSTLSNAIINSGTTNNLTITSSLNANTISTSNLNFSNASGRNLVINGSTATNVLLSSSSIQSSIITNCTAPNIFITNCTNTNLISQNGNFLNSNHTNFTCNNGFLNNISTNNVYVNNLTSNNTFFTNSTIGNLFSSNSTIGNLFSTNTTIGNIRNTSLSSTNIINTNITTSNCVSLNLSVENSFNTNLSCSNLNASGLCVVNNVNSTNITSNNLICQTQSSLFSNNTNLNASNSTLTSLISDFITTSSLSVSNINNIALSTSSLITTNITASNLNVTNIINTSLTNSTLNNLHTNSTRSNIFVAVISTSSLVNSTINQATISSLTVTNNLSFRKALNVGNNYSSPPLTSSGSIFTTNPINFTDNTTLVRNSKWFGSYFSRNTLSALNPNVKTTQAATVYIQGKPIEGINQSIDYSTSLALGYVTNTQGSGLTGQIMFERFDGNWFSSIYMDPSDRFIINNASASANSGIGMYVFNNNPITFASVPNVSNITPTNFIRFASDTTTFYSTNDSTNISSASVVFNGGISIAKTLFVTNITTSNISAATLNLSSGITTGNINFTGTLFQNGIPYVGSQWTTTNGNLFYTGGNIGIYNTAPTVAIDVIGDAKISGNMSTGNLNTTALTVGNINFTGSLYQNGAPYISSQWTTTNGNLFYTGGNIGIYNTAPTVAIDVNGDVKISGTLSTGSLKTSNFISDTITVNNVNYINFTSNNLVANNINYGVSSCFSGSFNAANNVTTPSNVTGFVFSTSNIVGFTATVNVTINATTNLYESFTLNGSYSSSGWVLYDLSFGDTSGIQFSINNSGQILYTSTNVPGYTSSIIRFTVTQTSLTGNYSSLAQPTSGNTYIFDSIYLTNTDDSIAGVSTGAANIEGGVHIKKSLTVASNISSASLITSQTTIGSLFVQNNIQSNAGILGPTFLLQNKYTDVFDVGLVTSDSFTASNSVIFVEPGNPGIYGAIGNNLGFGTSIISNASNDSMTWNYARLIIRGVALNTITTGSTIQIQPYILEGKTGTINTQSSFIVTDSGTLYGYSTWVSQWFPTDSVNDLQSLGVKILSMTTGNLISSGSVRIGPTYIQYSSYHS